MTRQNRHRIHRQTLVLDGPDPTSAQAVMVRELHGTSYLSALERMFDRLVSADGVLSLERVELDLGAVSATDLPRALLAKLEATVREKTDSRHEPGPTAMSSQDGESRAALIFLVSGRLPWWFDSPGEQWLPQAISRVDAATLRSLVVENENVRRRLHSRLDDATLAAIYVRLTGIAAADAFVRSLLTGFVEARKARALCWNLLLRAIDLATPDSGSQLMERMVRTLAGEATKRPRGRAENEDDTATSVEAADAWPEPWRSWARARKKPNHETSAFEGAPALEEEAPRAQLELLRKCVAGDRSQAIVDDCMSELREAESTAGVQVTGVGCLLLHPFLEELFRSCGWWDGSEWTAEDSQAHAIVGLAYLVFGMVEVPETDLVLQKQLVGMPWADAVDIRLADDEIRLRCDELLEAVRRHWGVVKSASDEWLRAQFYSRDGELFPVDDGYRCRVRSGAQDVLLSKLPWGYGVVRLPWMAEPIFVEWG